MEYKEDIDKAKERMNAWWDHEIIDRPVLSYYYPKKRGKLGVFLDTVGEDWTLAKIMKILIMPWMDTKNELGKPILEENRFLFIFQIMVRE